jgi:hypothetical protein
MTLWNPVDRGHNRVSGQLEALDDAVVDAQESSLGGALLVLDDPVEDDGGLDGAVGGLDGDGDLLVVHRVAPCL